MRKNKLLKYLKLCRKKAKLLLKAIKSDNNKYLYEYDCWIEHNMQDYKNNCPFCEYYSMDCDFCDIHMICNNMHPHVKSSYQLEKDIEQFDEFINKLEND